MRDHEVRNAQARAKEVRSHVTRLARVQAMVVVSAMLERL